MNLGIIGFGRMGQLLTRFLAQDFNTTVYDLVDRKDLITKLGAKPGTLDEICKSKIILLVVPISKIEDVLKVIAPKINKDAIVIDTCSVKEHPINLMIKYLPQSVSILGTHPMFGPDSIKDNMFAAKIVVSPIRIKSEEESGILDYLARHGMNIIKATPEEHDRQIAKSLVLTHLIGRGLVKINAKDCQIDTKGYRRLMRILDTVVNDSVELFRDMNTYNRFSKEMRTQFIGALTELDKDLKQ